ncbi:D-mannose binding lectin [Frankineae bacterium MT45]|nr:D-mannose binding lectin [Frankineae bacterium MT45]
MRTRMRFGSSRTAVGSGLIAVLMAAASLVGISALTSSADAATVDQLVAGQALFAGQTLTSASGWYWVTMQADGNLVVYENELVGTGSAVVAIWSSRTNGNPGAHFQLQSDGNAVVYSAGNKALWSTRTFGAGPDVRFIMQSDGNLVLYRGSTPIWNIGVLPYGPPSPPPTPMNQLLAGASQSIYLQLTSASKEFELANFGSSISLSQRVSVKGLVFETPVWSAGPDYNWPSTAGQLTMQTDGNLVLYSSPGHVAWSTHTAGTGTENRFVVQDDGNLVVYTKANRAVWSSGSRRAALGAGMTLSSGGSLRSQEPGPNPAASLVMQRDGNLVMYYGTAVRWSSGTHVLGSRLVLQRDGNLVIYTPGNVAAWSSGTAGSGPGTYLLLGGVADLQLSTGGRVVWLVG